MFPHPAERQILNKAGIIPIHINSHQLLCKIRCPFSKNTFQLLNYLSQRCTKSLQLEYVDKKTFLSDLTTFSTANVTFQTPLLTKPISQKLNQIIQEAFETNCSDIHFEPHRNHLEIHTRKQGQLRLAETLPLTLQPPLLNLIKLKAQMDSTEHRHPQNGQFTLLISNAKIECRVSTLPCLHGESIVIRLHNGLKNALHHNDTLLKTQFAQAFQKVTPGLWLVTGPIGHGKTTTYYRLLNQLSNQRVLSLEDPIEISQSRFVQLKLPSNIMSDDFMRNLLRQSINVVGIGEIRTQAQLKLAVNAAITGHCTLATFHASSLEDVTQRLETFGYDVSQQNTFLKGILFQSWTHTSPRTLIFNEFLQIS